MIFDWEVATQTRTPGEVLEYFIDGQDIVIQSNLAKNSFHLSADQAQDLMCGMAALINRLKGVVE